MSSDRCKKAEKSIITTYRTRIWRKFVSAINDYELIADGDNIAVCMSGGKDSALMAKCFQELLRHGKANFKLRFLVMDPGYNELNRRVIENNAEILEIPIEIFKSDIFDIVANVDRSPCYLCARMRRGWLYTKAKELGCNKIALGHHFDDVVETILMGILYNGQIQTMMPKLKSDNHPGMELIRPLYKVPESEIINWRNLNELSFIRCACRFTENCAVCDDGTGASKRLEMKELVKSLKIDNPDVAKNIFNSVCNVNLDAIVGYRKNGTRHKFLDDYNLNSRSDAHVDNNANSLKL
jgi:tRNA(Ile)-lysidine synthase TilS/MesJ